MSQRQVDFQFSWIHKASFLDKSQFLSYADRMTRTAVSNSWLLDWIGKHRIVTIPALGALMWYAYSVPPAQTAEKVQEIMEVQSLHEEAVVEQIADQVEQKIVQSQPASQPVVEDIEEQSGTVNIEEWIPYIIQQESAGNPRAVSPVGARGLMQIMPNTWAEETRKMFGKSISFNKAFNPKLNKNVGTKYLHWIQDTLRKWMGEEPSIEQILAAYNGGIGRLRQKGYNVNRMPSESIIYYRKITGHKSESDQEAKPMVMTSPPRTRKKRVLEPRLMDFNWLSSIVDSTMDKSAGKITTEQLVEMLTPEEKRQYAVDKNEMGALMSSHSGLRFEDVLGLMPELKTRDPLIKKLLASDWVTFSSGYIPGVIASHNHKEITEFG